MKSSHWWENYVVRYLVGTVVGAGAMLMFNEYSASPLKGALFPTISNFKDAGAQHLVVLGALGFAYCYIASAPMLTLHALRGELTTDSKKKFSGVTPITLVYFVASFAISHVALPIGLWSWKSLAIASGCWVLAMQFALFSVAACNRFKRISDYYVTLSAARSSETRQTQEYVESYRHLREHGNAFAIVFLELGLAIIAISVPSLSMLSALVVVWVLPASAVWLVGTVLESRLPSAPTN